MTRPLIQVRYQFEGVRPKGITEREMINRLWERWINTGKTAPGVRIDALDWNGRRRTWKSLQGHLVGCPGIVKQYAEPHLTMCDFDTEDYVLTLPRVWRVAGHLGIKPLWVEYDRTVRGWHVTIAWNRTFKPAETVALQAILGSDPSREMFNMARVLSGKAAKNPRWNLLFEYKLK